MKKATFTLGAVFLAGLFQPAGAQMMCAPGKQTQASGMMCGGMSQMKSPDPMTEKPSASTPAPQGEASGMCPCCRNMAMMKPQQHIMPGMDMGKPNAQ